MAKHTTGKGGAPNTKYANKEKSGSKEARNYDPGNDMPGGNQESPDIERRYAPADNQKPNSGPGNAPGSDRGS